MSRKHYIEPLLRANKGTDKIFVASAKPLDTDIDCFTSIDSFWHWYVCEPWDAITLKFMDGEVVTYTYDKLLSRIQEDGYGLDI